MNWCIYIGALLFTGGLVFVICVMASAPATTDTTDTTEDETD